MKKARLLWAGALTALTALVVVAPSGATPTSQKAVAHASKGVETATFEGGRRNLQLVAPRTVKAGDLLKIENLTNPNRIGPHTFSLVTKDSLPEKGRQQRKCLHFKPHTICRAIAKWHEFNFQTETIGRDLVEVGRKGWDRKGNLRRKGDSWFTDKENQRFAQKVSADPGKRLYFICAVHPFLQGKIKVVHG